MAGELENPSNDEEHEGDSGGMPALVHKHICRVIQREQNWRKDGLGDVRSKSYSRHGLHQDVVKDHGENHGKGNVERENVKEDHDRDFGKPHEGGPQYYRDKNYVYDDIPGVCKARLRCVAVVLPVKHELLLKIQKAHICAWVCPNGSAPKMGSSKKSAKGRLDKYYHLAKDQGYRARSAFKLVHLNKKYDFLSKSKVVVDLCAAPGGWLQVATKFMPKPHVLVGVDLVPIRPIPGVITLTGDITTEKCRLEIQRELKNWKADAVLHDGAPNVGKAWAQDAYSQSELVLSAFKLACSLLSARGLFITKIFRSKEYNSLLWVFNQLFDKVEATKPPSSRNVSAEIFVVCQGYKAPSSVDPKFFDPRFVFKDVEEPSSVLRCIFG